MKFSAKLELKHLKMRNLLHYNKKNIYLLAFDTPKKNWLVMKNLVILQCEKYNYM